MKFASQEAFRAWMDAEHAASDGIWIEFAKKGSGVRSVTYAEAVEVALCYGWIDGQVKRSEEEGFYRQRFTPRRARSRWSQIPVPPDLAEALEANPAARDFFATLKGPARYAVLYRIHDAKRPETRARRIAQYVEMLGRGETLV